MHIFNSCNLTEIVVIMMVDRERGRRVKGYMATTLLQCVKWNFGPDASSDGASACSVRYRTDLARIPP